MGHVFEDGEIAAEDFQCNIAAGAGDGFVHAHLHGLRELIGHTGDFFERVLQIVRELLLVRGTGIPHLRGEADVGVGLILAHGLGGEIGTAKFGDDALHTGSGLDGAFDLLTDSNGLSKRDARKALGCNDHGTFVQGGHELRADELDGAESHDDENQGDYEDEFAMVLGALERGGVAVSQFVEPRLLTWLGVLGCGGLAGAVAQPGDGGETTEPARSFVLFRVLACVTC